MHAWDRFDQFVIGREITVETDHKPLEMILRKPLFAAPKRLQRMVMQLQKYNLKVVYKRGTELYIADTLSRSYLSAPNQVDEEEQEFIRAVENVNMTKHLSISPERLQELQDLKKNIENGWPELTINSATIKSPISQTNHPSLNPGDPSHPTERRSSSGRLLKTPNYFY